jgi:hypothetical protein
MPTLANNNLRKLYEIDEHLWLEETIKCLKNNRLNELDIENLIEELESLSRRDKAKVESLIEQIIIHLLLLQYWSVEYDRNKKYWQLEIDTFRHQLDKLLTTNLTNHLAIKLAIMYKYAIKFVSKKTEIDVAIFPENCPYTLSQLLDKNYYSR